MGWKKSSPIFISQLLKAKMTHPQIGKGRQLSDRHSITFLCIGAINLKGLSNLHLSDLLSAIVAMLNEWITSNLCLQLLYEQSVTYDLCVPHFNSD